MSQATEQQQQQHSSSSSSSSASLSPSNSISLIKLDELSSFGATRQSRLPALIKLNLNSENTENNTQQQSQSAEIADQPQKPPRQPLSMPAVSADELEKSTQSIGEKHQSLPMQKSSVGQENQENEPVSSLNQDDSMGAESDFQMVDMVTNEAAELVGPSLPQQQQQQQLQQQQPTSQPSQQASLETQKDLSKSTGDQQFGQLQQQQQQPSLLGDSLIEMIINLRNENQNLVRALETNNEYVKERINEFKRAQEESKKRESQFALEKAEFEHQARKLQRQNQVLSERLKSMEAKLKDMKLEVSESLAAAASSKASSENGAQQQQQSQLQDSRLYPHLTEDDLNNSFGNSALREASNKQSGEDQTMLMDATSGELYNNTHQPSAPPSESSLEDRNQQEANKNDNETEAMKVGSMSKEELSKRFDPADKNVGFYDLDDPMKQCDRLEQQLNDIGKRDYEICLLQQQLNIYRQDFRLERMANLEAKLQIERLKNDIDRLCLERLQEKTGVQVEEPGTSGARFSRHHHRSNHHHHQARNLAFAGSAVAAADTVINRLGRKAARSAAKAAKYASKQAHREEKAAARYTTVTTSAGSAGAEPSAPTQQDPGQGPSGPQHHHQRRHSGRGASGIRAVRSEVMNDLLSTANKAMLTGYKMASTHVNLALDKLSQYEQAQAAHLAQAGKASTTKTNMGPPSMD